jgi:polygalacturonase
MNPFHLTRAAASLWLAVALAGCVSAGNPLTAPPWTQQVGVRQWPSRTNEFTVTDHGAKGDGTTLNTKAIQAAIDACAAAGGGVVTFKPGDYMTGSLFVKSRVALRIDKGVQLLGSQNLDDYPEIATRLGGIELKWPAALINVIGQDTAAVLGEGIVHARGKPFWEKYRTLRREYEPKGLRWASDFDAKRPRTILVSASTNVTVKGLTLKQAALWTVHVLYSQRVTVDGLIIQNNVDGSGPSTDGIDIDSSAYVLVKNCDIDCNDDNFCLKAGRDWDGLRVNRPTEYVVIRDCISRKGGGLVTFGSETSGGIRHVLAQRLQAKGTGVGLRFKSARTRGGGAEDVYLEDIEMDGVRTAIEVSMDWNPSYSYASLPEGYKLETRPRRLRAGKPVRLEQKPGIGCNIKWKAGNEPEYF